MFRNPAAATLKTLVTMQHAADNGHLGSPFTYMGWKTCHDNHRERYYADPRWAGIKVTNTTSTSSERAPCSGAPPSEFIAPQERHESAIACTDDDSYENWIATEKLRDEDNEQRRADYGLAPGRMDRSFYSNFSGPGTSGNAAQNASRSITTAMMPAVTSTDDTYPCKSTPSSCTVPICNTTHTSSAAGTLYGRYIVPPPSPNDLYTYPSQVPEVSNDQPFIVCNETYHCYPSFDYNVASDTADSDDERLSQDPETASCAEGYSYVTDTDVVSILQEEVANMDNILNEIDVFTTPEHIFLPSLAPIENRTRTSSPRSAAPTTSNPGCSSVPYTTTIDQVTASIAKIAHVWNQSYPPIRYHMYPSTSSVTDSNTAHQNMGPGLLSTNMLNLTRRLDHVQDSVSHGLISSYQMGIDDCASLRSSNLHPSTTSISDISYVQNETHPPALLCDELVCTSGDTGYSGNTTHDDGPMTSIAEIARLWNEAHPPTRPNGASGSIGNAGTHHASDTTDIGPRIPSPQHCARGLVTTNHSTPNCYFTAFPAPCTGSETRIGVCFSQQAPQSRLLKKKSPGRAKRIWYKITEVAYQLDGRTVLIWDEHRQRWVKC